MRNSRTPIICGSRAFTLIEVMVALAIISLSLLAIGSKMGQIVDTANALRDRTYANWVAQNKITELRLANVVPEVSSSSGEVDYAGTEWRWRSVVSETGVENLYRVDVSVGYANSEYDIRTVTGFIGEPGIPGQGNRAWQRPTEGTGPRE